MPIIGVVAHKGGVGKSTLASNLAAALAREGSVTLIDADTQGSNLDWAAARGDTTPTVTVREADQRHLQWQMRTAAAQHDWVIVDGPHGFSPVTPEIIQAADLVLVPVAPGPYDAWSAEDVPPIIRTRQEATGGQPKAAFVVSMDLPNTLEGRMIDATLAEYDLPMLRTRTRFRIAYRRAVRTGHSVVELGNREARAEIEALCREVIELCQGDQP